MITINAESVLGYIQMAYQTIDRLNLSMGMLAVIAIVVTIAFMLAVREVAAWFFKIDSLKKDIRALETGISRLEVEIRALREEGAATAAPLDIQGPKLVMKNARPDQFPINH